jgi:malate/lactate dehydrogenase
VNGTAPTGNLATFTVTTAPVNTLTVTVTESSGLYLSSTLPGATTAWSSGARSVTVAGSGSAPVYVWGTKVGTHDVDHVHVVEHVDARTLCLAEEERRQRLFAHNNGLEDVLPAVNDVRRL